MATDRGASPKKRRKLQVFEPDCLKPETSEAEPNHLPFPVVAIGASAGGLAAFTQLLKALSARSGLAVVLIQHLQPEHESALATLLARATAMPVVEVTDGLVPEPNHVYVIPPNKVMVLREGALRLSPRASRTSLNFPIDAFMTSLVAEQGRSAIGVVLSGTGSDGTLGLQAIRTGGGLTFAQDPKSAEWPAMPLNAAAASVDHVGSPRQIAAELRRIARHPYLTPVQSKALPSDLSTDLNKICLTLRAATGIDFPLYKPATIRRRVARRMALQKISSLAQYARRLRQDPAEATALAEDIFIHVTSFFRDSDCFQALRRRVIAKWCQRKPPLHLRIWVAGCASGEEVYTLAMLLLDEFRNRPDEPRIQIFGTDIQQSAIDRARAGIYPEAALAHVGQTRLKRYFVKVDGGFQVCKALRDLCVFARHDLAKDSPFSRLDLVSCRNVLIYMGPELQARALSVFQYALNPGGYLFLGNSESISEQSPYFTAEDATHRIFCRKGSTTAVRDAQSRDPARRDPNRGSATISPSGQILGARLTRVTSEIRQNG